MSNTSTKWIIQLIDKITAPAKKVTDSVDEITQAVEDVTDAVQFNERETKEALVNSKKYYNDLKAKIKEAEKEVRELGKEAKNAAPGELGAEIQENFERAKRKVENLRDALQGAEDDIKHLSERSEEFARKQEHWSNVTTGINQTIEMVDRLANGFNFSTDIVTLRSDIQRLTDASGTELDELTAKAYKYSKIFKEEPYKIAQAVNAMTQANDGSFQENFELIEKGFEKGADANKDMLDQLREYPGFFRELGLTNAQAVAVMAKAGKSGIFSDKAIDSLKEAQMSVTEMTQAQIDAISAIGLKVKDLDGKTAFDAIRLISEKMKDSTAQARQQVLADIFKGAGEDASRKWIEGYSSLDLDLDKIKSVETANKGLKSFISEVQLSISKVVGGAGEYLQVVSQIGQGALGLIGVYSTVNGLMASNRAIMATTAISTAGVATAQTAATASAFTLSGAIRAVGIAIMNIPVIGWILALIAALVALFTYFWNTSSEFRGFFYGIWEVVKLTFTKIWDFLKPILEIIWQVIKLYVQTMWNFWSSVFTWIYEKVVWVFSGIYNTISTVITNVYNFIKGALTVISSVFKSVFGGVYDWVSEIFEAIYQKIKIVLDKIKQAISLVKGWWSDFKNEAGEAYQKGYAKAKDKTSTEDKSSINDLVKGKSPTLSFYNDGSKPDKDLKGSKSIEKKEGDMSISGSKGSTSITMTINNYFTSKGNTDVRYLAEAVAAKIGDRLEDSIISIG